MSLSDVLGILALAVAILAIPFTYWLARRGRQRPDLRCALSTDLAINPESDLLNQGVEIRFHDRRIARVSRAYIAFWNRQGDMIRGADIVPDDPLRIAPSDSTNFLQARIVAMSRKQIQPSVIQSQKDSDLAVVAFDFLEEGDGFVVEFLYEGESVPTVEGTVRGAPVRKVTSISLSSAVMQDAQRSLFRRLVKSPGALVFGFMPLFAAIVFSIFAASFFSHANDKSPHLVDSGRYDLGTLDGQRSLADAIREAGNVSPLPWPALLWLLAFMLIMGLLMAGYTLYERVRVGIPATVLRPVPNSSNQPGSGGAAPDDVPAEPTPLTSTAVGNEASNM